MSFYVFDRPVSGQGSFVGRELLMRSLLDGVARGRSFAVIGGPKTGRSSVLAQLSSTLIQRWTRNPTAMKLVPVGVDLAQPFPAGLKSFAATLWDRLIAGITDARVFGNALPPKLPQPKLMREKDPWPAFIDSCAQVWSLLAGTSGWCRYVLVLDNADGLFGRELEELLPPIGELLSSKEEHAPASAVLAGGRMLRELIQERHSGITTTRPLFLGLLRETEVDALAHFGLPELEPAVLGALKAASGKHPFVVQRLLAELEAQGSYASIDRVFASAQDALESVFERLWEELDMRRGVTYRGAYAAPEHALMQFLIDQARETPLKVAERELAIRPLKEFADLLEYLGIVERVLRGDQTFWRAPFDLWNRWYMHRIQR